MKTLRAPCANKINSTQILTKCNQILTKLLMKYWPKLDLYCLHHSDPRRKLNQNLMVGKLGNLKRTKENRDL